MVVDSDILARCWMGAGLDIGDTRRDREHAVRIYHQDAINLIYRHSPNAPSPFIGIVAHLIGRSIRHGSVTNTPGQTDSGLRISDDSRR